MGARPGYTSQQFFIRWFQGVKVIRVVATELIHGYIQFEVDLVEPTDKSHTQIFTE